MRKLILRREIQAPAIDHMIVAFFDTHLETINGECEFTPAYRVVKKFCQDVRPDIGVMGGDWLDLSYLSKFTKDTPLLVEGRRFHHDLELSRRELASWRSCFGRFEFITGNHDDRITRYVERFPLFEGEMSVRKNYGIDDLGIGWTDYNGVLSIGKPNFAHGEHWNKYHAEKHLREMGDHIFYGHVHSFQAYCAPVRAKRQPFMAMGIGCLSNTNPHWKRNSASAWLNQFLVIEVAASGNFTALPLTIIDGEFSYAGYTWKA
jgi:hypothetical protein